MDYAKAALKSHRANKGKLEVKSKVPVTNKDELSIAYTPGVAAVSSAIADDRSLVKELTWRANTIAVISDGSSVLGLGNIGPEAAIPVMEGKCILFKEFAGVDAVPIVIATQDPDEFVRTVINIAPSFSGINLEDISAPRAFEIETRLQDELDIPVFHDDQHGTAIVILAALINAAKVKGEQLSSMRVVINGAGAAGIASAKLLFNFGIRNLLLLDSKGIISSDRELPKHKKELLEFTNADNLSGSLTDAMRDADIFIGVSRGDLVSEAMVESMSTDPIIIAMANPIPEIMPDAAIKAGALIVATGRSDFPNQVNNVLGFPGIFRGLLDKKVRNVTDEIKVKAAEAIASLVSKPTTDKIIPSPFNKSVARTVAEAV
ncbi:MAG: NADP-dependent malic enzyme [Candidatus Dojkabacteria bacterium]